MNPIKALKQAIMSNQEVPDIARWKITPFRPRSVTVYQCDGCSFDNKLMDSQVYFFEGAESSTLYRNFEEDVRQYLKDKYPEGWYCEGCLSHLSRWFVIAEPYTSYADKTFWDSLPISVIEKSRYAEKLILREMRGND